jgi:hypothetical protein
MPGCARPFGYVPRQTHECDAAVLVRRHLAEFLGRCEERAGPLPAFVKAELEGFAGCGDFELGFVRTCCRSCGDELRVPFSCKSRGCCPSCMGRRMVEGAALLVDHVLPAVGYRQWVLSFPGPMAVRLGYDAPLLAAIAGRLARAVMQDMRHRVKLDFDPAESSPTSSPTSSPRPRRIGWAKLLARVFALDTRCRKCGGRMRVLEVVSDPDAIARILHGARAPPAPPPPGQLLLLP